MKSSNLKLFCLPLPFIDTLSIRTFQSVDSFSKPIRRIFCIIYAYYKIILHNSACGLGKVKVELLYMCLQYLSTDFSGLCTDVVSSKTRVFVQLGLCKYVCNHLNHLG